MKGLWATRPQIGCYVQSALKPASISSAVNAGMRFALYARKPKEAKGCPGNPVDGGFWHRDDAEAHVLKSDEAVGVKQLSAGVIKTVYRPAIGLSILIDLASPIERVRQAREGVNTTGRE